MKSHQTPICDTEPITNPILLNSSTSLFVLILFLLLLHSLFIEWSKRKDPNFQILSTQSRTGYITLQCLAFCWTTMNLIRYTIDPLESFLPNTVGCAALTYSSYLIPTPFYMVYLYLVLLRLENLDGTYLNTSWRTVSILRGFICSLLAFQIAFFFVYDDPVCLQPFQPSDMDRELWYCELVIAESRAFLLLGGVFMILVLNLVMGALFTQKLQQLIHRMKENQHVNSQLRKIVIQNTVLILTGSISTFVCYILFFALPIHMGLWQYSDMVMNCCVIGLTFPHNRARYKCLCGCCIRRCWRMFDSPGEELPRLPTDNDIAIIGEDIVLELGPGLVPQNKEDSPDSIELRPSKEKIKKRARMKRWKKLRRLNTPSGSMCASDGEETDYGSRRCSLSSLSEIRNTDGVITEKPSDESVQNSKENANKISKLDPRMKVRTPSTDTLLKTPTLRTLPRSATLVPFSRFMISQRMIDFLSMKRRASV